MPEKKPGKLLVSFNGPPLKKFDRMWRLMGYRSRSEAIRDILSKWTKAQGKIEPSIVDLEKRIEVLEALTAPKVGGEPWQR